MTEASRSSGDAAGAALAAVRDASPGSRSFVLVRPPGHHAMREGYDAASILADPAAARLVDATRSVAAQPLADASLVPVKTVATPLAHFECYVECEGL